MSTNYIHTGKNTIGTSAQPVVQSGTPITTGGGIQLYAGNNSGIVYVGPGNVTANSNSDTDGFPLSSGSYLFYPAKSTSQLWAISSISGETLHWAIF